jgi:hypothetical protein
MWCPSVLIDDSYTSLVSRVALYVSSAGATGGLMPSPRGALNCRRWCTIVLDMRVIRPVVSLDLWFGYPEDRRRTRARAWWASEGHTKSTTSIAFVQVRAAMPVMTDDIR